MSLISLFRDEFESFSGSGSLTRLSVCFSRDNSSSEEAKYVQDLVRREKEAFVDLLMRESTTLFVCGDARNMAKDVNETVIQCVKDVLGEIQGN